MKNIGKVKHRDTPYILKYYIMKLIYIKSTMEPKNYAALRSILKKEQGEKIAPYVFKVENIQLLQEYLKQERIIYETYKLLSSNTQRYKTYQKIPENKTELAHEDQELEKAYQAISQDKERKKLTKPAQKTALRDLQKRL